VGKPISRTTLNRHFKRELEHGRAILKARIMGKFHEALENGDAWAVQMGLRCVLGWRDDAYRPLEPVASDADREMKLIFVLPTSNLRDEDRDEEGPRPGQKLLPPPRERPMPEIED
jgi:hypothetical protein